MQTRDNPVWKMLRLTDPRQPQDLFSSKVKIRRLWGREWIMNDILRLWVSLRVVVVSNCTMGQSKINLVLRVFSFSNIAKTRRPWGRSCSKSRPPKQSHSPFRNIDPVSTTASRTPNKRLASDADVLRCSSCVRPSPRTLIGDEPKERLHERLKQGWNNA